jgi:hypothetical protein
MRPRAPATGYLVTGTCRESLVDLFAAERHIVLALYCLAMALFVALLLMAALAADYIDDLKNGHRRSKKWWQK